MMYADELRTKAQRIADDYTPAAEIYGSITASPRRELYGLLIFCASKNTEHGGESTDPQALLDALPARLLEIGYTLNTIDCPI